MFGSLLARSFRTAFTIIVIVCLAGPMSANDTLATLGAGGLIPLKSASIVMESEELQISLHKITVKYIFRNRTGNDVDATVAFPLPDLNGGELYNSPINLPNEARLNFLDFAVKSDGKPVDVRVDARAFDKNKDITRRLNQAGVPVSVLLQPLNAALIKVPHSERQRLEREQLIVPDEFNPPLPSVGRRGWWATWTMRVQFYWTQHFSANSSVAITHSYRPVVGGSYIYTDSADGTELKQYCGGAKDIARMKAVARPLTDERRDLGPVIYDRTLDYLLTTANNWSGPIRKFHLSIVTDSADEIVLTCTPGLRRIGPTRYELARENYSPDREFHLMILTTKELPWR